MGSTEERLQHEAGFNDIGAIKNNKSWAYKAGQIARRETIITIDVNAPITEGKLLVEEKLPWYKKIF